MLTKAPRRGLSRLVQSHKSRQSLSWLKFDVRRKRMRFEVCSALAVGTALPLLETIRRGFAYWKVEATTMLEDYVAGALLLAAGFMAVRAKPVAPLLLFGAWGYVTGMMSSSFWYQLEETIRGTNLEPRNSVVLAFKTLLWGTCVTSLWLSLLRARAQRQISTR